MQGMYALELQTLITLGFAILTLVATTILFLMGTSVLDSARKIRICAVRTMVIVYKVLFAAPMLHALTLRPQRHSLVWMRCALAPAKTPRTFASTLATAQECTHASTPPQLPVKSHTQELKDNVVITKAVINNAPRVYLATARTIAIPSRLIIQLLSVNRVQDQRLIFCVNHPETCANKRAPSPRLRMFARRMELLPLISPAILIRAILVWKNA
jgi:hypothetical protein